MGKEPVGVPSRCGREHLTLLSIRQQSVLVLIKGQEQVVQKATALLTQLHSLHNRSDALLAGYFFTC